MASTSCDGCAGGLHPISSGVMPLRGQLPIVQIDVNHLHIMTDR
jgi:hypothetical protein